MDEREGGLGAATEDQPLRYADAWSDKADRLRLIEQIPRLSVRVAGVAALLEDFRPQHLKGKEARKETQGRTCSSSARRSSTSSSGSPSGSSSPRTIRGPHLVFVDRHSDFRCFKEAVSRRRGRGWSFPSGHRLHPLREAGFAAGPRR